LRAATAVLIAVFLYPILRAPPGESTAIVSMFGASSATGRGRAFLPHRVDRLLTLQLDTGKRRESRVTSRTYGALAAGTTGLWRLISGDGDRRRWRVA
jgi:hypothetical protein